MIRLFFAALALCSVFACRTGHLTFSPDEIAGFWRDEPATTADNAATNPDATAPLEALSLRFSASENGGVAADGNATMGYQANDQIVRNLAAIDENRLRGEMRVKKRPCNRHDDNDDDDTNDDTDVATAPAMEWVPVTLTRVADDQLELTVDCKDCGIAQTTTLWRQ